MTKRLFIAVDIFRSQDLIAVIDDFKKAFQGEQIKWADNAGLHITTQFLGNTDENKVPQLIELISAACKGFHNFSLEIKGAGIFESIHNPTVLWLGVEQCGTLKTIKEKLDIGLKEHNFPVEQRIFRPHLTLGRVKQLQKTELLNTMIANYNDKFIIQDFIREVILFESILTPMGPIYKKLFVFKLEEPIL